MTTTDAGALASQHHHPSKTSLKRRVPSTGRLQKLAALATKIPSTSKHTHRRTHSRQSVHSVRDTETESEDEDDDMAATFLQYCAFCEKQIEVPDASILYCSDRCRKQDLRSSQCYELFSQDTPSPTTPDRVPTRADIPIIDIIPQFSPTIAPRPFSARTESSPFFVGDSATTDNLRPKRASVSRANSEAAQYLAQFHSKNRDSITGTTLHTFPTIHDSTPSLSSTATSAASPTASRPFTPLSYSSRPQGRRDRWGASFSSKSVDLVTPVQCPSSPSSLVTITEKTARLSVAGSAITSGATTPEDSDSLSYQKRRTVPGSDLTPGKSSLKQMFQFDQMRAAAAKKPCPCTLQSGS